jgi:hypothetical protein
MSHKDVINMKTEVRMVAPNFGIPKTTKPSFVEVSRTRKPY